MPAGTRSRPNPAERSLMRWRWEATGWIGLIFALWGTDLMVRLAERGPSGAGKDTFRLVTEQATSALAVLVMILFVVRWVTLFPLRRDVWAAAVVGHTAGSILFAFGHKVLMIALRIPVFAARGLEYVWREPFVANLIVEYQKDLKIYFGIVAIVSVYRWIRRQRQGETAGPEDRLLVQTGQGLGIIKFDDIDYLEAARNYVTVHAHGKSYLMRDTLGNLEETLPSSQFIRVHRSFIVHVGKIREVRQHEAGTHVMLQNEVQIPVSRANKAMLMACLTGRNKAADSRPDR